MPIDEHWMQCCGCATTEEKEKGTRMFGYKLSVRQQHETLIRTRKEEKKEEGQVSFSNEEFYMINPLQKIKK